MKKIIILILSLILFNSCEKVLNDYDLPYERKLVVQAIMDNSALETQFFISLTQPPLGAEVQEEIDPLKFNGYIESEGNIWKLIYKSTNDEYQKLRYFVPENFEVEKGKRYNLYLQYEDLEATATTVMPHDPEIIDTFSVIIELDDYWDTWYQRELYCKVAAEENLVYSNSSEWYSQPVTYKNADDNGNVDVYLGYQDMYADFYIAELSVYDEQFYDYIISKKKYQNDEGDIFSTAGLSVKWNIKGDGIGVFFAVNKTIVLFRF